MIGLKVFFIFLLFVVLEVGLVIGFDFLQPMPTDYSLKVLKLPYYLLGGQEIFLLLIIGVGIVMNAMRSKQTK